MYGQDTSTNYMLKADLSTKNKKELTMALLTVKYSVKTNYNTVHGACASGLTESTKLMKLSFSISFPALSLQSAYFIQSLLVS